MATEDEQYTSAGRLGQRARSYLSPALRALYSGYEKAKSKVKGGTDYIDDLAREYAIEELVNLRPRVANIATSAIEAGAGFAGQPLNLGRFPLRDIPTRFDRPTEEEPTPATAQEEVPTITVSKRAKRKEDKSEGDGSMRIWRVLGTGDESEQGKFYETKEAAEAALKRLGKKGGVVGIKFPGETQEESIGMRDRYMERAMEKVTPSNQREVFNKSLERIKSERVKREEAKRAAEAPGIERFNRFKADIAARESAQEALNIYNRQVGSLRRAYNNARRAGDDLAAFAIGEELAEYERGVPKEMGARKRFAEKGAIEVRNREFAERRRREEEERQRRASLNRTNPDSQQFTP